MAILQSTDELEENIGNKYTLVILAAKRARQLKEGHPPQAHDTSPNPLSIAMTEIQEHKVISIAPPEEDVAPAPRDVITSLVTSADFELDGDLDLEDSDAVDDLAALLVGADEEEEEAEAEAETEDGLLTAPAEDEETAEDADTEEEEEVGEVAVVSLEEVEEEEEADEAEDDEDR